MERPSILWRYALLSGLAILVNLSAYTGCFRIEGFLAAAFVASLLASLTILLTLPVPVLALTLDRLLSIRRLDPLLRKLPWLRDGAVYGLSLAGFSALHIFLYLDRFLFRLYGYHVNGFVLNLLTTPGGLNALGADNATRWTFALIVAGFAGLQAALLILILKVRPLRERAPFLFTRKSLAIVLAFFGLAALFDKGTYGISRFTLFGPVLTAAEAFPLYIPCSLARLARFLGFEEAKGGPTLRIDARSKKLHIPLTPIRRDASRPRLNIVWLVAESWRWDMLDPSIMPATWAFSERSARFSRHYSGGNGTRMGLFTMFTGLYGPYWFPSLESRRGAVLMDLLIDEGYQMDLRTSAAFTYPEFDRTIFSRVPRERMREAAPAPGWAADRANVDELLDFIEKRDPSRPFLSFMFFESPHAPYLFPPECALRKPYPENVNYLKLDPHHDAPGLKNRYANSCTHLDTQFARILTCLEKNGLLDSTIVILTGDHGEEFMEKGRWGHSSDFTDEQTRVPLVLRAPGRKPEVVDRLTSHLDIAPTVMTLLGVTNPPADYSLGFDLFGPGKREYTIVSGWEHIIYVDSRFKAELPISTWDVVHRRVMTADDRPVQDRGAFYENNRPSLLEVLRDLGKFKG